MEQCTGLKQAIQKNLWMKEEKTEKKRELRLNGDAIAALTLYKDILKKVDLDGYIFESRKANEDREKKLDVKALHKIIKDTCKELSIKGNYGTQSTQGGSLPYLHGQYRYESKHSYEVAKDTESLFSGHNIAIYWH